MRVKYLWSSRHTRTLKSGNKHRQAVPTIVKDMIRICDVVMEVLDARFIEDTRNYQIEQHIAESEKRIIYVINKSDLRDEDETIREVESKKLFPYILISCKNRKGKTQLIERIKIEAKRGLKGKKMKIAHAGVIGYPNTGKSSLINFLTGRNAATTSKEAGYTKGMKKVRLSSNVLLLDTPGIIPDKENSNIVVEDLKKHAKINVEPFNRVKNPELVVHQLMKDNPGMFEKKYEIDARGDSEILIEALGKKKGLFSKGGIVDSDRAARAIIRDWQEKKT